MIPTYGNGFNPENWYWLRKDGRVYSSQDQGYVESGDEGYQEFLAKNFRPTGFPVDDTPERNESEAELARLLASYGIWAFPPAPAELREAAYRAEADPLLSKYQQYQAESGAWAGLAGTEAYDGEQAARAQASAGEALAAYLEKKREIRERFPDVIGE
jgi:hypothetical protein